jgi:hypothetical protein
MSHVHLFITPEWLILSIWASVTVFVLVRGGWRERAAALAWAIPGLLIHRLIDHFICEQHCLTGRHPLSPWISLGNDLIILGVLVLCVRGAHRYWPVVAGSCALLSLLTDALRIVIPGYVTVWPHFAANAVWWYLMGAAIVWGTIAGMRERALRGSSDAPPQAA